MQDISLSNALYNLSNPHFGQTLIITDKNNTLKGQFVQFKVVKGNVEYLYPAEKYCFLPENRQQQFWEAYRRNGGEFPEVPAYIQQISMSEIRQIIISPVLVPGS